MLAVTRRLLEAELADRLVQPETRFRVQLQFDIERPHQALVDKRFDAFEHGGVGVSADRFGRLKREAPGKNGKCPEQRLFLGGQKIVRPADGIAERLLAARKIARSSGQEW